MITPNDFATLADLVKQRSGLIVTPDKSYLFESRLMPLLGNWNMNDLTQLAEAVRQKRDEKILRRVTEAMTTNESSFFRDGKPFDQFRKMILPAFAKNRDRQKLRIWSAACSSGQEAYSLGMSWLEDCMLYSGFGVEITGTDISSSMVARAQQGLYSQFEVQRGLPVTHLMRYFTKQGEQWQVNENLRKMAHFGEGNLVTGPYPPGLFDVIFCRNVLIYFDTSTKAKVLDQLADHLQPDGALFLGGAENVLGLSEKLYPMQGSRGLYRLFKPEPEQMLA